MEMNWVQRKIYLYNVTFGLYMLDWWERFLFNMLMVVLMWFVCYNGFRYASDVSSSLASFFSISFLFPSTLPMITSLIFLLATLLR